jgi:hypothetical protein
MDDKADQILFQPLAMARPSRAARQTAPVLLDPHPFDNNDLFRIKSLFYKEKP